MIDNALMKDTGTQDAARRRLLELVENSGSDLKSLSLHLGRNQTYLQQYLNKGSPRQLAWEDRVELARVLRCSPEELTPQVSKVNQTKIATSSMVAPQNKTGLELVSGGHATFTGPRDLPIL